MKPTEFRKEIEEWRAILKTTTKIPLQRPQGKVEWKAHQIQRGKWKKNKKQKNKLIGLKTEFKNIWSKVIDVENKGDITYYY